MTAEDILRKANPHNHNGIQYPLDKIAECVACPADLRQAAKNGDLLLFSKILLRIAEEKGVKRLSDASGPAIRDINYRMLGYADKRMKTKEVKE